LANVLITGTSKGIGFETALAFARAGHTVHATMRNPAQAPTLAAIAATENLPLTVSAMDVDSDESVSSGITAALAHGPIDILVNNAGLECVGSVEETPLSTFRAVMETNFFGALRCTQAVLPHMRQRQTGCIVNVSSVAGRFAFPPFTPYCASKWALEALSEALAGEVKSAKIRVLLIEPGIIDTAMARRIAGPHNASAYGQSARFSALFTNSLQQPVPPSVVADHILQVVTNGTEQLRHLVGPDAVPLTQWRQSMTDEQWIALNSADDQTFFASLGG
jgi:NAD(P)-dependent dehydrogenase (short-subunit alcohol dehydrogenase family)